MYGVKRMYGTPDRCSTSRRFDVEVNITERFVTSSPNLASAGSKAYVPPFCLSIPSSTRTNFLVHFLDNFCKLISRELRPSILSYRSRLSSSFDARTHAENIFPKRCRCDRHSLLLTSAYLTSVALSRPTIVLSLPVFSRPYATRVGGEGKYSY